WPLPPGIHGLGPMQVQTYRTKGKLYDIDMSQLPDGKKYAEISRKVPRADATRTMVAMEADLARAGVERCADQSSQIADKLRSLRIAAAQNRQLRQSTPMAVRRRHFIDGAR